MKSFSTKAAMGLGLNLLVLGTATRADLVFQLTDGPELAALAGSNPALYNQVRNGFIAAGGLWSAQFSDPITVNLTINFESLGSGILGSTQMETTDATYSTVKTALGTDSTSSDDATAFSNLQSGSVLNFYTNDRAGAKFLETTSTGYTTHLDVSRANAKALGLLAGNAAPSDGSISFSNAFSWDFDRSDGINPTSFDFIGTAAHEIGHALGYSSGVDTVDFFSGPNGSGENMDLNGVTPGIGTIADFRVFNVLDLYRYSSTSGSNLDLAYGDTPFFSIDGGTTNLALFSTGVENGDGSQASHWKDNLGLGIMDPTLDFGELDSIKALDLRSFDVIGYDLVPEPGLAGVFMLVGLSALKRRRNVGV